MTPMRDRVAAGAALLDAVRPGWAEVVEPADLAMESCADCVLGQLYGHYAKGLESLGLDPFVAVPSPFGFEITGSDVEGGGRVFAAYDRLAGFWRDEIAARLVPAGVVS